MSATMQFVRTASPEDQARAQLYGLIASLFQSAPDAQLLSAIVHADGFREHVRHILNIQNYYQSGRYLSAE